MKSYSHIIFDLKGVLIEKTVDGYNIIQEGLELLEQCHTLKDSQGQQLHKLYALSNAKSDVFNRWKMDFPAIFNRFDGVVISEHVGFKKPDHRIFHYLLQTYQLKPEWCIYIDDSAENVIAAQQLGFTALECDDHENIKRQLKHLNVL